MISWMPNMTTSFSLSNDSTGSLQITACEDCDYVHADTRKQSFTQWQCVKFPKIRGLNPVAPNAWSDPPYNRCVNINMGHCPLFTPRRDEKIPK